MVELFLVGGQTSEDTQAIIGKTAIYDSKTQTFRSGPALREARTQHSVTELLNGDVLVAGGWTSDNHTTSTVELISGESLKALPPMLQSRSWHSATRLLSGNVLVVGGRQSRQVSSENKDLNSVELYDFAKNSWQMMSPMPTTRIFHSATLLLDGRLMILGGATSEENPAHGLSRNSVSTSVLFWDSATEQWSTGADMPIAREGHDAILLSNGDVLVCGGLDAQYKPILDLSLWNHATGRWTSAGTLTHRFDCWSMALLGNGDVFVGTDINTDEMVVWSPKSSDLANTRSGPDAPQFGNLVSMKKERWGTDIPENLTRTGAAFHFVVAPLQVPIDLKARPNHSVQWEYFALLGTLLGAGIAIAIIILKRRR